ncbi:MAG: ABC transporter substrate-binding protein [Clostridiales bacterium]|nr:ABC transporter substrate-binding protein [Candidatus Cacconaster stercorequi]
MKKYLLSLLLTAAVLLLLSGCGNIDDTVQDDVLDELSQYYQSDKDTEKDTPLTSFVLPYLQGQTLDPITCMDGAQQTLGCLLYDGLFALDTNFTPQNMLAKSYTYDAATFTYTIQLRSGVTFSDGSSLDAEDVVSSLQRACSSERYRTRMADVSAIYAESDSTVCIRLKSANGSFAARLDIPIVKSGTETELVPLGTGPYVYKTGKGGVVYLSANANWWQKKELPLKKIELLTVKDDDTMAYAFYAREIHLLTRDLTATMASGASGGGSYTDADTSVMQYIGINTTRDALNKPAVRQALSLGIDRVGCVNSFLMGHGRAAQFPLSPASPLYPAGDETLYSPDNFSQAMKKSKLDSGSTQELTMLVNEESTFKLSMAKKIAADLSTYDLKITVEALPWDEYVSALNRGNFDLYYGECKLTADWDLSAFLLPGGALNYGGFHDPATTALLNAYAAASTDKARQSAMQALCRKIQQQSPIIPVCFKSTSVMVTAGAVDAITPTAADPFYDLTSWKVNLK